MCMAMSKSIRNLEFIQLTFLRLVRPPFIENLNGLGALERSVPPDS